MKPASPLLLSFALCLPLSLLAQSAAPTGTPSATKDSKLIKEAPSGSYRDEAAKLVLSYPSDFALQPAVQAALDQEKNKQTGVMRSIVECVSIPLMAARMSDNFAMLIYLKLSSDCMGMKMPPGQIGTFATSTLNGSLTQMGEGSIPNAPVMTTMSGHAAAIQYGTSVLKSNNVKLYGAIICLDLDGSVGCVEQMAGTQEELKKLGKLTIQFDGQQAIPLIADSVILPAAAPLPKP